VRLLLYLQLQTSSRCSRNHTTFISGPVVFAFCQHFFS
jgi:hypothetical protein